MDFRGPLGTAECNKNKYENRRKGEEKRKKEGEEKKEEEGKAQLASRPGSKRVGGEVEVYLMWGMAKAQLGIGEEGRSLAACAVCGPSELVARLDDGVGRDGGGRGGRSGSGAA